MAAVTCNLVRWSLNFEKSTRDCKMKVKDLIELLNKKGPNLEVLCYTEDKSLVVSKHMFRLLHIESVDTVEAQKVRSEDGMPSFKFGKSDLSEKHVTINVTGDF